MPLDREIQTEPHKPRVAYAPVGTFENSTYRRCPHCHSRRVKRNGKSRSGGKYRYRCNSCRRHFTMNIDAVDIARLFREEYDSYYKDIPYMETTKYRKIRALKENKEVRNLFNEIIAEYSMDKSFSDNERDILAFHKACELASALDQKEIDKHLDSWYFLANYNYGDLTYHLSFYNNHLAVRYDVANSRVQNLNKPLLHCSQCGSSHISRYGFNNNGRRRIKCNSCNKVSVIHVKHLLTQKEFLSFLNAYFAKRTENKSLIEELTEKMNNDYHKIRTSHHFESLLSEQMVITHSLKEDIFNAFIAAEYLRTMPKEGLQKVLKHLKHMANYNSCGQIESLSDKQILISQAPIFYKDLHRLPDNVEAEDLKQSRLFYQVAAAMHTSHFNGWKHRAELTFEELKGTLQPA